MVTCLICKKECGNTSVLTKHLKKCVAPQNAMWVEIGLLREKIKNGDDTKETKNEYERLTKKHRLLTDYGDIMCATGRPNKKANAMLPYNRWNFCKRLGYTDEDIRVHLWDWFYIIPGDEYKDTLRQHFKDMLDVW